jgi:predicted HicB family RNase H-like nuclease
VSPNQPKPGTRLHNIRLEDELWAAAQAKAAAAGTSVSALVREFLKQYVNRPN